MDIVNAICTDGGMWMVEIKEAGSNDAYQHIHQGTDIAFAIKFDVHSFEKKISPSSLTLVQSEQSADVELEISTIQYIAEGKI